MIRAVKKVDAKIFVRFLIHARNFPVENIIQNWWKEMGLWSVLDATRGMAGPFQRLKQASFPMHLQNGLAGVLRNIAERNLTRHGNNDIVYG
jgi:hypothetical protein